MSQHRAPEFPRKHFAGNAHASASHRDEKVMASTEIQVCMEMQSIDPINHIDHIDARPQLAVLMQCDVISGTCSQLQLCYEQKNLLVSFLDFVSPAGLFAAACGAESTCSCDHTESVDGALCHQTPSIVDSVLER